MPLVKLVFTWKLDNVFNEEQGADVTHFARSNRVFQIHAILSKNKARQSKMKTSFSCDRKIRMFPEKVNQLKKILREAKYTAI